MATSDVCVRLLKRRLVVPGTAPLTEKYSARACERRTQLLDSPQSWQRQISGTWCSKFLLTDKQFLIQETLAYICMGSVWYCATYACVESTQMQSRVTDVQFMRSQSNNRVNVLDAKWPNVTFKRPLNLHLYLGLYAPSVEQGLHPHWVSLHAPAS